MSADTTCKNCIHYQTCVDTFRRAKQDGEYSLINEDEYFAYVNDCVFYADERVYHKPIEGAWEKRVFIILDSEKIGYRCSECNTTWDAAPNYCPNCGAKMKGERV